MIKIHFADGLFCPVITCDHCDRRITDAEEATYEWAASGEQIVFLHRACSRVVAHATDEPAYWAPLEEFFVRLAHNTGQTPRQMVAVAHKMESMPQ